MIKWIIYIFLFFSLNNIFGFTPPTIVSGAINLVTSVTASASANITGDGGSAITSRGFVWSTSNSLPTISSYDGITTNGTSLGAFTHSVNALCPGTLYYIRPYSTNAIGTSYGSISTFTTTISLGDTWVQKSNLTGGSRDLVATFVINNKAYISCGRAGGFTFYDDLWEYDQFSDTWTQKANFLGSRRLAPVGASIAGKGYVGLGMDESSVFQTDFYQYDPNLNSWTSVSVFPGTARTVSSSFAIGNLIYIGFGNSPGTANQDLYSYNPSNNTWNFVTNYPTGNISGCFTFVYNSKVYIGTSSNWEYSPANNQWTQKSSLPSTERSQMSSITIGDKGYVVAGEDINSNTLNDVWEYNITNNSWVQKSNFAGGNRRFHSLFNIANKGYLAVGFGGTNEIWEYTPSTVPSIITNSVSNVTFNSVEATANPDLNCNSCNTTILSKGFVWGTSTLPTLSNYTGIFSSDGSLSNFNTTILGLNKLTNYYIRSYITTSNGTNYGNEVSFLTTQSLEDSAPNNGDGNGDGIQDSQQDYVHSILNSFTNKYITIVSLDGIALNSVEILSSCADNKFSYPGSLTKFTVSGSTATVKLYFHDISSLQGYSYRKKKSNGEFFNFTNYTFGTEVINGKTVATATLTLTDGGQEDYDGIINGSITDPGGPAILASDANIPVWDWRYLSLLVVLFGIGNFKINRIRT